MQHVWRSALRMLRIPWHTIIRSHFCSGRQRASSSSCRLDGRALCATKSATTKTMSSLRPTKEICSCQCRRQFHCTSALLFARTESHGQKLAAPHYGYHWSCCSTANLSGSWLNAAMTSSCVWLSSSVQSLSGHKACSMSSWPMGLSRRKHK